MKPFYLDTSAIVKVYVRESGSTEVLKLLQDARPVVCCELGYVEVRAALAAAMRAQRLRESQHATALAQFRSDWVNYSTISTDTLLIARAAELAEGFGLRGYDSLHVASAERARIAFPAIQFLSFDQAMNRAAKLLGFAIPALSLIP